LILVFYRKSFASSAPPEGGTKGNLRLFLTRKRDSVKREHVSFQGSGGDGRSMLLKAYEEDSVWDAVILYTSED
jgi:hypothetical protein